MLNATEAKRLTDTAAGPIIQKELEKINKCVKTEASKGNYSFNYTCNYSLDIRREITYRLKQFYGYKAVASLLYPEIDISWRQ